MKLRILESDQLSRDVTLETAIVRLGRDPSCEIAFDPKRFATVSGLHAELRCSDGNSQLFHRSRSNRTLLNDEPIEREAVVRVGDRIRLGFTGPTIEILDLFISQTDKPSSKPSSRSGAGSFPTTDSDATQMAIKRADLRGSSKAPKFAVSEGGIIGRDSGLAKYCLDHPQVSRTHARLISRDGQTFIVDLGSTNGT